MTTTTNAAPYGQSQPGSVEDILGGGGGAPAVKFPVAGTRFSGTVLRQESQQQRDFGTQKPLFWDDGKPKMQVVVTCLSDEDGEEYRLFFKGQMLAAAKKAVAVAGLKSFPVGGGVVVTYTHDESRQGANFPAKQYTVEIVPADPAKGVESVLATPPAPAQQPQTVVTPAPSSKADPQTTAELSPEALAALKANGLI